MNIELVNPQLIPICRRCLKAELADNVLYEAKEDVPGVRFQKHGKENWVLYVIGS